jgi:HAD superfamily hydrolase (TIGR01509 family)
VLADTDEAFTRAGMDRAFRALRAGADLIAMARNRWFATPAGPAVDIGAVVAALAYAAEVEAVLVGKPAADFFLQGARDLGLPPEQVAMVGDDPEADVLGAQEAGLSGIFVGKAWERPGRPDAMLESIAQLPALLA